MAKIEYQYLRFSTFKKFLVFLLFIFIIIIVPKIVNAYNGPTILCQGTESCNLSGCRATLACPDNQQGKNVRCLNEGIKCRQFTRPGGPCDEMNIQECDYVPIPCNCSGYGWGWYDYPGWEGCDDCTTNPVDWNNACAPCGQAYALCDGCNWDTNWNNHKCAGSAKTCNPNEKVCNPISGGTGSDLYQCDSTGCASWFYQDCGYHHWTDQYRCSGTMQQRLYQENGCWNAACFTNDWWMDNQECGSDYWTNEYRCIGTMQQRKYVSRGCSGGGCYSNEIWYDWSQCGSDYWGDSYTCSGTMQQRLYYSRGCSGGWCYNTPSWQNWSDCGSDYWTNNYRCVGTMQQRQYVSRGCSGGGCYSNNIWYDWSQCGSDYWGSSYNCSGTMQQRLYYSQGCSGTSCYSNASWQNWTDCGSDYWGSNYTCSGTMQQRQYFSRGCSGGNCYNNASWQNWSQCGSDYWTNEYRCVGTMQQRKYISSGCSGGSCYSNTIWYDWSQCGSDYWGSLYSCSGDWRTRQYFSAGCSGTSCYLTPSYQNWENCNTYDGWYGSQLRDYYCSAGACVYSGNTIPNVPTLIAPPSGTFLNYDPTFQATVSDPDNNQVRACFEILGYGSACSAYVNSGQTASYGPVSISTCYQNYWRAYAQDSGGLTSGWTGYWLYSIDKVLPTNSLSYASGTIKTLSFTVTLTESDACSGINTGDVDVRINGGAWQNYATTINDFTYTGTDGSTYRLRYRVLDNAGNWSNFVEGGDVLISLNHAPTATSLNVTPSSFCTSPPFYTFNWTYTDPDSDTESRFDFQVDNNSDFSSPEINTTVNNLSYPSPSGNSQSVIVSTSGGSGFLSYNTTYYWRARVYDSFGTASGWISGSSFKTLIHHYPLVDFTWVPTTPNVNETTTLTDASNCWDEDPINGSDCSTTKGDTYQWTMTGGTPNSSITENTITKYATLGLHDVTLQVTDSDGHTCSKLKQIRINYPLPTWREIRPF